MSAGPPAEQRREHFRIDYLPADRPEFVAAAFRCPVGDVSEHGVSLIVSKPTRERIPLGAEVEGTIRFRYARDVTVRGVVLRYQRGGVVAVKLVGRTVPWAAVLAEQRALLKRYESARR